MFTKKKNKKENKKPSKCRRPKLNNKLHEKTFKQTRLILFVIERFQTPSPKRL